MGGESVGRKNVFSLLLHLKAGKRALSGVTRPLKGILCKLLIKPFRKILTCTQCDSNYHLHSEQKPLAIMRYHPSTKPAPSWMTNEKFPNLAGRTKLHVVAIVKAVPK